MKIKSQKKIIEDTAPLNIQITFQAEGCGLLSKLVS